MMDFSRIRITLKIWWYRDVPLYEAYRSACAVQFMAKEIAKLPLKIVSRTGVSDEHPLKRLLRDTTETEYKRR